ncbi:sigma factor-like helix-turn-helix DNA-binding protein [uncultured Clostridium sp.]|uniref:sigma factor-like helix-turn-helix DNA-binding protein n=1 Tax=uncultured Clostridium sp. TaxID=59620 RepID=UPI0028E93117|nr:sigma factor-like helix-turn-helix DNA-binding protein [uncultured Clostridium sp.]
MNKDLNRKTDGLLNSYNLILAEIKNLEIEIEELKFEYNGYKSINYNEKTSKTFKINNVVEEEYIRKETLIDKLMKEKENKERLINKVDNALSTLDDKERSIVKLRCIDNRPWKEVGELLGLDYDYAGRIKRTAINKISDLIWIKEKYSK